MRGFLRVGLPIILGLFMASASVYAGDSIRVGSRVLVVGDSAAQASALLGKPAYKSRHGSAESHAHGGHHRRGRQARKTKSTAGAEQWQFRRDGRVIVVTLVDGRVANIDEHP